MPGNEIAGGAALVTGASRGFGRGIATALSKAGAHVAGVARDRPRLEELRAQLGESFTRVSADAADPVVAGQLTDEYHPCTLVLNAGATPLPRPVQDYRWQTSRSARMRLVSGVLPGGCMGPAGVSATGGRAGRSVSVSPGVCTSGPCVREARTRQFRREWRWQ